MLFACLLAVVNLVENPDMEALVGTGDVAGWRFDPQIFSVENEEGRNGTRGLVWHNDDPGRSKVARGRLAVRPGTTIRFGGWIKVKKLDSDTSHGGFYLEWYTKDGKRINGTSSQVVKKRGVWTFVEGTSVSMPADVGYAEIFACAKRGSTGEIVFDEVFAEASGDPFLGEIWTSAYRNAAVAGKVRVFGEINRFAPEAAYPGLKFIFRIPREPGMWVDLKTVRHDDYVETEAGIAEFRFGTTPIQLRAETNGVYIASKTIFFERFRGQDPRRVHFDERNRTVVSGKRFFPVGMITGRLTKPDVDTLVEGGFNCVAAHFIRSLTPDVMDYCAERGLMVVASMTESYYGARRCVADVIDESTADSWVGENVSNLKDHPALLAWAIGDECELFMVSRLRERRKLLERLDPDHPTWIVLCQPPTIREYMGGFDIIGTDPYPIADIGQYPKVMDGIRRVSDWTRMTRREVYDGSRPMWQVPQCFDWAIIRRNEAERLAANTRPPTEEEIRNMTWQCMVEGANGISYYAFQVLKSMEKRTPFKQSFAAVSKVAKEVRAREHYFLGGERQPVATGNECVIASRWELGDTALTVVVNASEKEQLAQIDGTAFVLQPREVKIEE